MDTCSDCVYCNGDCYCQEKGKKVNPSSPACPEFQER